MSSICLVCRKATFLTCSNCGTAAYCSIPCQHEHWENHREKCEELKKKGELELNKLGSQYFKRGRHFQAIRIFETLVRYSPNNVEFLLSLASCYFSLNEFDKSLSLCIRCLKILLGSKTPIYYSILRLRAMTYEKLERYKDAVADISMVLSSSTKGDSGSSNGHQLYHIRGKCFLKLSELDKALEDISKSIHLSPSWESWCSLGLVYSQMGRSEECSSSYLKAEKLIPDNPRTELNFRSIRAQALKKIDPERSAEDERRIEILKFTARKDSIEEEEVIEENISEEIVGQRKVWRPFEDEIVDKAKEESEIKALRRNLRSVKFENLKIMKTLGLGSYGSTYLCRLQGDDTNPAGLVVKIPRVFTPQKLEEVLGRDSLFLEYHPNVVPILSKSEDYEDIDLTLLPNYEEMAQKNKYWFDGRKKYRTGINLMKYYEQDLGKYLDLRIKGDGIPLESLEICYIMRGILRGVEFLHKNRIVHRDLHKSNIFINSNLGRVLIGDFGRAIDFRLYPERTGFKMNEKDQNCKSLSFSNSKDFSGSFRYGDYEAPEIEKAHEKGNIIDYEFCDIFSIGLIGKDLIRYYLNEEYRSSKKNIEMGILFENLLKDNPFERLSFSEAIARLLTLTKEFSIENQELNNCPNRLVRDESKFSATNFEDSSFYSKLRKRAEKEMTEKMNQIREERSKYFSSKVDQKDSCKRFQKDLRKDEELERREVQFLKDEFGSRKIGFENLLIHRLLGGGCWGRNYIVEIRTDISSNDFLPGVFTLKILIDDYGEEEYLSDCMKVSRLIEYDRNLSIPIFHAVGVELQLESFPDNFRGTRGEFILKRYHRKTLHSYFRQRKEKGMSFNDFELCYILKGLLDGVNNLMNRQIVHRAIHGENVFVDEEYGRVWINITGKCIIVDKDFRVKISDSQLYYREPEFDGDTFFEPGFAVSSPPEIFKFSELVDSLQVLDGNCLEPVDSVEFVDRLELVDEYLDYSKHDIYSIGLMLKLLTTTLGDYVFNHDKIDEVKLKLSEQGKYSGDLRILMLIGEMCEADFRKRVSVEEARKRLRLIIEDLETRGPKNQ